MRNLHIIITLILVSVFNPLMAQQLTISELKVTKTDPVDDQPEVSFIVDFTLSDLSGTPSIEVKFGMNESCEGLFSSICHIKHYSDGYYLKYEGARMKLSGNKISLKIDINKEEAAMINQLCVVAKKNGQAISELTSIGITY